MCSDLWRKDKFQSHISDIGLRQGTEGRRGQKEGREKGKREGQKERKRKSRRNWGGDSWRSVIIVEYRGREKSRWQREGKWERTWRGINQHLLRGPYMPTGGLLLKLPL